MDFKKAKKYVLDRLSTELSSDLYYHHVEHTLDVCNVIEVLAKAEGVSEEDLMLLKTAGLYHDLGFVERYEDNEPIAATIAGDVLPTFGYTKAQVETIKGLILATRVPQKPKTHLEKIICDADLDYLGRNDFHEISKSLMKEWFAYGLVNSHEEFNKRQISFFKKHSYFTETAKRKRETLKSKHLSEIQNLTYP